MSGKLKTLMPWVKWAVSSAVMSSNYTLKINPVDQTIEDARFKTFGCASAIASSSVLTEIIKGKKIEEAARITNKEIADYLGGLPEQKMHCSVMGMEALQAAIENYYTKKGIKVFPGEQEKIICKCFNVSEKTILKAIELNNLKTVEQVTDYTKAGGNCGQCKGEIEKILMITGPVTARNLILN